MNSLGFARLAVCIPPVRVANPRANADAILRSLRDAAEAKADVALFPELSLSGYTCGDLFLSSTLLDAVGAEFDRLRREAADVFSGVAIVGMPLELPAEGLFNVAALFQNGRALGFVPKTHLPNYREFYELRHFRSGADLHGAWHLDAPVAPGLCFRTPDDPRFGLGVEICEDLWAPQPPSGAMALAGATLLCNLSASNELVGKADYRRSLVLGQSARCMAAYAYAGSGVTESTQDLVFGGHGLVAENGVLLGETKRFVRTGQLLVVDVDLERLTHDRRLINTYHPPGGLAPDSETLDSVRLTDHDFKTLRRSVPAHPFVPADPATLAERCEEVFQIQSAGLAKRIESARIGSLQLGVSGGLDSTLALLVAVRACDLLGMSRTEIRGVTMPGFGTSSRTLANARKLMEHLGVSAAEIDIRAQCLETFRALGHQPFGIDLAGLSVEQLQERLQALPPENREDLVFENVQARIRTLVLMSRGFVVGTGDLSELALGWCTYNGDHMAMYAVNAGVPKTLVQFVIRWSAEREFAGAARETLLSIADTEISPELLPVGSDSQVQSTQAVIGPYELHDFFLYHFLRFGFGPRKILFLARQARFDASYTEGEIKRWLGVFCRRFFGNQFKRSCLPDGPKVGSICLSPRGDWRMPSDADAAAWLDELKDA